MTFVVVSVIIACLLSCVNGRISPQLKKTILSFGVWDRDRFSFKTAPNSPRALQAEYGKLGQVGANVGFCQDTDVNLMFGHDSPFGLFFAEYRPYKELESEKRYYGHFHSKSKDRKYSDATWRYWYKKYGGQEGKVVAACAKILTAFRKTYQTYVEHFRSKTLPKLKLMVKGEKDCQTVPAGRFGNSFADGLLVISADLAVNHANTPAYCTFPIMQDLSYLCLYKRAVDETVKAVCG